MPQGAISWTRVGSRITSPFGCKMSSGFGTFADRLGEVILERSLIPKNGNRPLGDVRVFHFAGIGRVVRQFSSIEPAKSNVQPIKVRPRIHRFVDAGGRLPTFWVHHQITLRIPVNDRQIVCNDNNHARMDNNKNR